MELITFTCRRDQVFYNENQEIIVKLNQGNLSPAGIEQPGNRLLRSPKLLAYVEELGEKLEREERFRTAEAYRSAARSLKQFLTQRKDIPMSHISISVMQNYEEHLKEKGKSLNTISFYIRTLRAIYNKAVSEKRLTPLAEYPFSNLSTGVYKTRKRALKKNDLHRLSSVDPSELSSLEFRGLLYFLFCFHARGMSFVDLAFLQKTNIQDNKLVYKRKKTGRVLTLEITPEMREIISVFEKQTKYTPYLFPIVDPSKKVSEYRQYLNALRDQNLLLKTISKKMRLNLKLSTHMARHSWATIAKNEQIPTAVISEALGHQDEKTTSIYLDSFDDNILFQASKMISQIVSKKQLMIEEE